MTLYFKNNEITIYRRRRVNSTDRYTMSATYTGYPIDIQPANNTRLEQVGGKYGAVYDAWVESSVDIKEGDQVVDSDGKRYSVKGVEKWANAMLVDHKQIVLVSQDA